jgi:hypothetical protein
VASAGACSFPVINNTAKIFGRPLAGSINVICLVYQEGKSKKKKKKKQFAPRFLQKFTTPGFSKFQFSGIEVKKKLFHFIFLGTVKVALHELSKFFFSPNFL